MLIASLRLTIKQLLVFILIFFKNFYKLEIRWTLVKQRKAHMKNTYADMKRLPLFCFLCSYLTLNVIQSHLKQPGIKSLDRGVQIWPLKCVGVASFCKRYSVKRVWWGVCFPLLLLHYYFILYFIPFLDTLSPLWSFTVNVLNGVDLWIMLCKTTIQTGLWKVLIIIAICSEAIFQLRFCFCRRHVSCCMALKNTSMTLHEVLKRLSPTRKLSSYHTSSLPDQASPSNPF